MVLILDWKEVIVPVRTSRLIRFPGHKGVERPNKNKESEQSWLFGVEVFSPACKGPTYLTTCYKVRLLPKSKIGF